MTVTAMMGMTKAKSKTRLPGRVFIDSNGRTYPVSSPKHTCSNKSTVPTAALTTAAPIDNTPQSEQRNTEAIFSKRIVDRQAIPMSAQTAIYVGPQDPQIESSKSGAARNQAQTPDADISQIDPYLNGSLGSEQRADSLSRDPPASSTRGLSLLLSPATLPIDTPASSPHSWPNTDAVSMHSDQDFDLGYKGKPAQPFCYKLHTRVWSSAYTRPVEDLWREILEVRYPVVDAANEERVSLLSGWTWHPRSLFMRNL